MHIESTSRSVEVTPSRGRINSSSPNVKGHRFKRFQAGNSNYIAVRSGPTIERSEQTYPKDTVERPNLLFP